MARWVWSERKERALMMVFEGRKTLAQIAAAVEMSERAIDTWVAHPDFKARLARLYTDLEASLAGVAYVTKAQRILALVQVAEIARHELESMPRIRDERPTRNGPVVSEEFNAPAMSEFRAALADIAAEKGDRKQRTELSGKVEVTDARELLAAKLAALAERTGTPETDRQPNA